MKKVFNYIMIATATLVLAASCSKNNPPVFSDSNAFVAFDSPTAVIAEAVPCLPSQETDENKGFYPQTTTLKVPVTLGSVRGIEETVKFTVKDDEYLYKDYIDPEGNLDDKANWIDKTAHAGVNFNLKTTSGTLTFDATNRTQYIEFEILYVTDYTGDMKFDIELSTPENVALGYNTKCTVTIGDVNHPLTAMLGAYTMTGQSYWHGMQNWAMTILKDDKDDHMVWFNNLHNAGAQDILNVYGNVDDEMTTITIPFGQETEAIYTSFGTHVKLWGLDADFNEQSKGNWKVAILKDENGKVTGLDFGKEYGMWLIALNEDETDNANFAIYLAGTLSAVKK